MVIIVVDSAIDHLRRRLLGAPATLGVEQIAWRNELASVSEKSGALTDTLANVMDKDQPGVRAAEEVTLGTLSIKMFAIK